jgi:hypothetical protein
LNYTVPKVKYHRPMKQFVPSISQKLGWRCGSRGSKHLPSEYKSLGSSSSTEEKKKKKGRS